MALIVVPAMAAEPDDLTLPQGFHANVVAEGLGPVRHLTVRNNGDIYLSTGRGVAREGGDGIVAVHLGPDHRADRIERFGVVDGGTGITMWHGALYAASASRIYRFAFHGDALLPDPEPTVIVDNIAKSKQSNHGIAIDKKGGLFVTNDGTDNICTGSNSSTDVMPAGLKPCPDLGIRAGIRRFAAGKPNQSFANGEQVATGIRDMTALTLASDGTLYAFMHGRDSTAKQFPNLIKASDDDQIADEMAMVAKGADFGWPYSYYDGVRKIQLVSPEYGGDGKQQAIGNIVAPVLTFQSKRAAPVDMVAYVGKNFPAQYRGGFFICLARQWQSEDRGGQTGHNVVFVPRGAGGKISPQLCLPMVLLVLSNSTAKGGQSSDIVPWVSRWERMGLFTWRIRFKAVFGASLTANSARFSTNARKVFALLHRGCSESVSLAYVRFWRKANIG
jgi:glucose/arabinose dehydrogenase